jgi:hypothetical protein
VVASLVLAWDILASKSHAACTVENTSNIPKQILNPGVSQWVLVFTYLHEMHQNGMVPLCSEVRTTNQKIKIKKETNWKGITRPRIERGASCLHWNIQLSQAGAHHVPRVLASRLWGITAVCFKYVREKAFFSSCCHVSAGVWTRSLRNNYMSDLSAWEALRCIETHEICSWRKCSGMPKHRHCPDHIISHPCSSRCSPEPFVALPFKNQGKPAHKNTWHGSAPASLGHVTAWKKKHVFKNISKRLYIL